MADLRSRLRSKTLRTCRICLLGRDQSISPVQGFSMDKKPLTESFMERLVRNYFPYRLQALIQHIRDFIELASDKPVSSPRLGVTEHDKKLIAPCKCKGTMKYVHRGCLDAWRSQSSRKDSFFKCEQCYKEYAFKGTFLSKILSNQFVVKIVAMSVFVFWFYSWFAFIHIGLGDSTIVDDIYYVDQYEMYAMGLDDGIYFRFNPSPTDPEKVATMTEQTMVTTTAVVLPENKVDNEDSPSDRSVVNLIVPPTLRKWIRGHHIQLVYSSIILTMFDFVITSPSMILTSNLLFFLWRSYRFGFNVDFLLLMAFLAFGLARTFLSIYATIDWLMQRYLKLRCIEIQDLEPNEEDEISD